jgi:hypothetical protein
VSRSLTPYRYLTQLCDQLVVLLSKAHVDAIVWKDEPEDDDFDSDEDDDNREFNFEVSKSDEQEENVIARPGFTVRNSYVINVTAH